MQKKSYERNLKKLEKMKNFFYKNAKNGKNTQTYVQVHPYMNRSSLKIFHDYG